ncbi:MAG: hypothetical protein ACREH3_01575 [Geminicoccales bacterium]
MTVAATYDRQHAAAGLDLALPQGVEDCLPATVRAELSNLNPSQQSEFVEEFERKAKTLPAAYLCSLMYCHYGFLDRWGMTVIMWVAAIITFGIVGLVWWIIDLFRMPALVRAYNRGVALDAMRRIRGVRG